MAEESTTTEGAQETQAPKASGMLPLVGIGVAGAALGIGLGVVLGPKKAAGAVAPVQKSVAQAESAQPSPIYLIDNLVLNPAGTNGTRFLLMTVALEVKDEATVALLKARDPELRDDILKLFGTKSVDQVSEAASREELRGETLAELQKVLPAGTIRKVYFPQFVIQ